MLKLKPIVIGSVVSAAGTLSLFSVISFALLKTGLLPEKLTGILTAAAGGATLLLSGILTARMAGERGLLHGAAVSGVYAILFVVFTFIQCGAVSLSMVFVRIFLFLLCGMIGGVLGVGTSQKVRF